VSTEATPQQRACPHREFRAAVAIQRVEDTGRFIAEITVTCAECALPFRFLGAPAGIAWDRPTASIDGTTLNAPIEPETVKRLAPSARFQAPPEWSGSRH
jgi:hypothetical protein